MSYSEDLYLYGYKEEPEKPQIIPEKEKKSLFKKKRHKKYFIAGVTFALLIAAVVLGFMGLNGFNHSFNANYKSAFVTEHDEAYDKMFKAAQGMGSDTISIKFNSDETPDLDVLTVHTVAVVTDETDNKGNLNSWVEVEGAGTFMVNLRRAECITNPERRTVFVRVPAPELTDVHVIRAVKTYFSDIKSRSGYSEGAELTTKQESDAVLQIRASMLENEYVSNNARNIATLMIENFVRECNPGIKDLTIEVEFY